MKLSFLGANHEVTGSCTLLETEHSKVLIDCGMEQGRDVYENVPLPVAPGDLNAILVTHAHIDHTGRIPLLVQQGYNSPIYATEATNMLCSIMLRDAAHIQEMEAEWKNRKAKRAGDVQIQPLYTIEDAEAAMQLFQPMPYNTIITVTPDIKIRFIDVGHLLGSASIEVWVTENEETKKIVFSGDIGNYNQPLIRDPKYPDSADVVIMESTYGDRLHGERPDYVGELTAILQETFDRGGNVVIPSFAVGRTQEMLYFLREIKEKKLVKNHDGFPVYIDSPMAIEATQIFKKNVYSCFDDEAMALIQQGIDPIGVQDLHVAVSSEESRAINFDTVPKVIISASGMCDAGRIRHHLKHNLWRKECTILFVGYQSVGTLGRTLLEGATSVKLFGEVINVSAELRQLTGLSGHADKNGLLDWIHAIPEKPKRVFIIHGEDQVENIFADCLSQEGYTVTAPYNGEEWDLTADVCVKEGNHVKIARPEGYSTSHSRAASVYQRLVEAGRRLMTVIKHNEGGANKDLARFASQIQSLCDKWDR